MQLWLQPRPQGEEVEEAEEGVESMEIEASRFSLAGGVPGLGRGGGLRAVGLGARRLVRLSLRVAEGGGVVARVVARPTQAEAPHTAGVGYPTQGVGYPTQGPRREKPAYTDMIAAALLHMEEDGCCTMALGQGSGGVSAAALKKCAAPLRPL